MRAIFTNGQLHRRFDLGHNLHVERIAAVPGLVDHYHGNPLVERNVSQVKS